MDFVEGQIHPACFGDGLAVEENTGDVGIGGRCGGKEDIVRLTPVPSGSG